LARRGREQLQVPALRAPEGVDLAARPAHGLRASEQTLLQRAGDPLGIAHTPLAPVLDEALLKARRAAVGAVDLVGHAGECRGRLALALRWACYPRQRCTSSAAPTATTSAARERGSRRSAWARRRSRVLRWM